MGWWQTTEDVRKDGLAIKLYPTKPVKVGDLVSYEVGAGHVVYKVTYVERDGTPYGILVKGT